MRFFVVSVLTLKNNCSNPLSSRTSFQLEPGLRGGVCNDSKTPTMRLGGESQLKNNELEMLVLTTSRRLTWKHAKLFPTVKRRTCIHVLRHYSRNSYSNFGRHATFSESSGSQFGRPRTKGTANNDRAHSFCGFLANPFIQHLFLCPTSQERE